MYLVYTPVVIDDGAMDGGMVWHANDFAFDWDKDNSAGRGGTKFMMRIRKSG